MRTVQALTMASRPGLVVTVHHPSIPPSDVEWDEYLKINSEIRYENPNTFCNIVFTDGPGPNSDQRKRAVVAERGAKSPVAVVSSSTVVRGVVTAFTWFRLNIKAFDPREVGHALDWLKVEAKHGDEIRKLVRRFEMDCGVVVKAAVQL